MRVERLQPVFVVEFPTPMQEGLVYVSLEYNTCGHMCACGCGTEVMTPLSPAQWSMAYDGRDLSLWPSVGNWSLPCRSHYVLRRGRVHWSRTFSIDEVERNRQRDQHALNRGDRDRIDTPANVRDGFDVPEVDAHGTRRGLKVGRPPVVEPMVLDVAARPVPRAWLLRVRRLRWRHWR